MKINTHEASYKGNDGNARYKEIVWDHNRYYDFRSGLNTVRYGQSHMASKKLGIPQSKFNILLVNIITLLKDFFNFIIEFIFTCVVKLINFFYYYICSLYMIIHF